MKDSMLKEIPNQPVFSISLSRLFTLSAKQSQHFFQFTVFDNF